MDTARSRHASNPSTLFERRHVTSSSPLTPPGYTILVVAAWPTSQTRFDVEHNFNGCISTYESIEYVTDAMLWYPCNEYIRLNYELLECGSFEDQEEKGVCQLEDYKTGHSIYALCHELPPTPNAVHACTSHLWLRLYLGGGVNHPVQDSQHLHS